MFVHQYIIETDWEMFMKNKIWATAKTFGHDGKKDLREQFHNSKEAVALSLIERINWIYPENWNKMFL